METAQDSDDGLVRRFQQSSESAAFEELVQRHTGKVRAVIYAMVMNDRDAEDLTHETFVRAFRGLDGFRLEARFSTWLYRIAVNTTRHFLRRRGGIELVSLHDLAAEPAGSGESPAQAHLSAELAAEVERALGTLSPEQRLAFGLVALQGMRVQEAAQSAGCLAATMSWRLHQARKKLSIALKEYLDEEVC